ncbi:MAG: CaiB/BaiF CoA transferase family protein [Acidimicrobiales bacterium]
MSAPKRGRSAGPLDGLLVADFSRVVAGPYAAMMLGDLGADVVKVERPGAGDDTRGFGPPFVSAGAADAGDQTTSYYLSINRNKRAVAWDLATPDGRRKARALAERADVVIENFKPGGAAKLGLAYDEITATNPRVVYCSISGFGSSGEGAQLPGYDFLVQAVGGLMSITGDGGPHGQPRKVGVALVDVLTALFASNAVLAALVERSSSGRGQRIEVDLLSSSLAALINQASTYLTTGSIPRAMGNRHPSIAPYETLAASDRQFVVAVGNDGQFAALARVVGKGWMGADSRYERNADRVANRDEMVAELEEALSARSAAEWVELLNAAGIPSGVVNDVAEAFALAEKVGLSPVVHVTSTGGADRPASEPDPTAQVASPMRFSRTPVTYRLAPPRLGEHSAEVESQLGLGRGPDGR